MLAGMSSSEFEHWRRYYLRYGFDADRLEWATANAGAAAAQAMGSRVRANQLVPRFQARNPRADAARLTAWLESAAANAERWFDRGQ
jgi:hypothetical protein